jgi:hypothetical protein
LADKTQQQFIEIVNIDLANFWEQVDPLMYAKNVVVNIGEIVLTRCVRSCVMDRPTANHRGMSLGAREQRKLLAQNET